VEDDSQDWLSHTPERCFTTRRTRIPSDARFSEWKEHDKYKKAFERLLGDLKAGKSSE